MHSPNNKLAKTELYNDELKLIMNNTQANSVDSLLIHNYNSMMPSPQPVQLNSHQQHHHHHHQQQQHHHHYRRVRPEPINEKTIVGSVVGFFHDVVGTTETHQSNSKRQQNVPTSAPNVNQPTPIELIKEQIEWLHYEPVESNLKFKSNLLLVLGYKTGFSVWLIDLNGVATEVLSIREPNITHVKLVQQEQKLLLAACKLIQLDASASSTSSLTSSMSNLNTSNGSPPVQQIQQPQHKISIVNLLNGDCMHEILFNGDVLDMKSNAHLLCINSWNRIDAFDLTTFEHRFSVNSCYSQISKSSGKTTNPFSLGERWLAFADNKFHVMLSSQGGVSTDIEQSYTAAVLNTAKSISKGLVKISEQVVNSVVAKSKQAANSSQTNGGHSPRLGSTTSNKMRHDSKEDYQAGICTVVDTKVFVNNQRKPQNLHDENQNWIVAHFLAHQEPIYALEFNQNGRLLVSADCLGQYFNVFQVNANSFKCTRTVVKHLYSLYRGDTTSKVRNICFSNDSRWLAISTKRGTTHIFPLNSYGGPVNARTHSKPYVVNRTSKHQRTAGFVDSDAAAVDSSSSAASSGAYTKAPLLNNSTLLNGNATNDSSQQYQMQQMLQQQYDNSFSSPILINNNPKLKSLMEPFVIQAYGQLKQPNANSTFQSSVISSNASAATTGSAIATSNQTSILAVCAANSSTNASNTALIGSNIAATALSSAALVTENMTNFGIKNFSLLASNTTNMIQYDNVCAVSIFADSRGYLSPEEPRDYSLNRLKPANSLFVISDVNGNLVEYVLDVIIDTSKGNKPTNDSPIQLKITPKAQWPLQRYVSSDELRYPLLSDNPIMGYFTSSSASSTNGASTRKPSNNSDSTPSFNSYSPNSFSTFYSANNSLSHLQQQQNEEWIKQIEVTTHVGPHRRLFMGPQFTFRTFNSNLTTTKLNAASSSVISDVETPIIDLSGDIELNTLDLNSGLNTNLTRFKQSHSSSPMQINNYRAARKFDSTPTYIEVGSGSFQEGMPVMCSSSTGSHKSLNSNPSCGYDLLGGDNNLIESLADAMNEFNANISSNSNSHSTNSSTINNNQNWNFKQQQQQRNLKAANNTPAIAIASNTNNSKLKDSTNMLLMNANTVPITAPSSAGSNCSNSAFTVGSYFLINPTISGASNIIDANATNCYSSSSSSSGNSSANCNNDDELSSNNSSTHSSLRNDDFRNRPHHVPSLENIQFQDDNLLQ